MPAESVFNVEKKVANIWDNRENKKNYQNHKPHYMVIFSDETTETKSRAKLQGENMDLLRGKLPAKATNGSYGTFLFTIEQGEYEGTPWSKIQDILAPMGSAGPGTSVPGATPAHPTEPKTDRPSNPAPNTLIYRSFIQQAPEFFNRLALEKEMAITQAQAVNLAVKRMQGTSAVIFIEDGVASPDFLQLVQNFNLVLTERRGATQVDYYNTLIDLCQGESDCLALSAAVNSDFILGREDREGLLGIIKTVYESKKLGVAKKGGPW